MRTPKSLKELVFARSEQRDGCLLWKGSMRRGKPFVAITVDGKSKHIDLHRYLAAKKFNLVEGKQVSLRTTCGNPNCIKMDHIELTTKSFNRKQLRSPGRIKGLMANNKAVFTALVIGSQDEVASSAGLSLGTTVRIIQDSTAMIPYFQAEIQRHLGMKLSEARKLPLDQLKNQFNLSRHAINYIESGQNYPIFDEDLYYKLLDECEVVGDHLVWVGSFSSTGVPLTKVYGGNLREALPLFMHAAFGKFADVEYENTCGFKNCVNPHHCEVKSAIFTEDQSVFSA